MLAARTFSRHWPPFRAAATRRAAANWPPCVIAPPHQPPRITRQRVTTQAAPPGTLTASVNHRLRGVIPVRPHTYEITFSGQAGRTLRAQFDDCKVTTGPDTTILRAELPDQAALSGLVQRIAGLGLVVIDVHLVTPGSGP